MKKVLVISLYSFIILGIIVTGTVAGEDTGKKRGMFGVKLGQFGEGTVTVNDTEYDTDAGTTFGVFLDYPITSRLYAGGAFDISNLDFGREEEKLLNAAVTVKYNIAKKNSQLILRPAVQVGYAMLNEVMFIDNSTYITLTVFTEAIFKATDKFGIVTDIGLFWALSGGNDEYDVTGGPMLTLRAGFVFL